MVRGILTLLSMTGIPRLIMRLMMDGRVPLWLKIVPTAFAAIYIISPIDIVPDFLPFLGRIDDLLALAVAGLLLILLAPRDVLMELAGGSRARRDSSADTGSGATIIEGEYRTLDDE